MQTYSTTTKHVFVLVLVLVFESVFVICLAFCVNVCWYWYPCTCGRLRLQSVVECYDTRGADILLKDREPI